MKRRSTPHEIVTMKTVLSEVGQMVDGRWEYKPGWHDERVAKAVSATLNANHAKHVRRSLFGHMRIKCEQVATPTPAPVQAPQGLRTFVVTDVLGKETTVYAHFMFDNTEAGGGLIFRRKNSHNDKHDAVASWAHSQWSSVVRVDA